MAFDFPAHPGAIIEDVLEDLGLTITDAAKVLGVSRITLSKIVNGRSAVSPEMAVRLSKAFGRSVGFWLRLQLNYDLALAEDRAGAIKVERYEPQFKGDLVTAGG
jgi:addiction module HigA family antidote